MNADKLMRMANQIAAFFAHEGGERGAESVAEHLRKFWHPSMRAELLAAVDSGRAADLVPLARAAAALLAAADGRPSAPTVPSPPSPPSVA